MEQKIFAVREPERERRENQRGAGRRSAAGLLARGPRRVGKSLMRNIARPLPFHWTPQETSRMLLKMEKDVNACLRDSVRKTFSRSERILADEKKEMQNALALAISCGRLAAFTAPLSDSWDVRAAAVGRAENFLREVALHGPRSSGGHLADYVHQHLLLYCQDLVVAHRSFRCSGGN